MLKYIYDETVISLLKSYLMYDIIEQNVPNGPGPNGPESNATKKGVMYETKNKKRIKAISRRKI